MNAFNFQKDMMTQDLGGGVRRQILNYGGKLMMARIIMPKGGRGERHTHPHEQITYVAAGSFEFTIGEEKHTVHAGDSLYMESNVEHETLSLEDGSVLIDVFTPIREDFLK